MLQIEINAHRASLKDVRHRKNINNFSDAEIATIRAAYLAVYGITNRDDNRGYQYWAGKHGRPEADFEHGRLFLPWHRAYLYGLEKAIQYHVPNMTLLYWNWTGAATLAANTLPAPCLPATLHDESDNLLFAGPIYFRETNGKLVDRMTVRGNRKTPTFMTLKQQVADAFEDNEFLSFQGEIDGPHRSLHVRVGGDMGFFDYAG